MTAGRFISTQMAREIAEIPDAVQRLIDHSFEPCVALGRSLYDDPPPAFLTCARGTSDQAALYFKYLIETQMGIPVASLGPSIASVYDSKLSLHGMVCLTISQSGGSPDLTGLQGAAAAGGARTVALLNTIASPIGDSAQNVIDLQAGEERAVAATKSFVCSLVAAALVVAGMTGDGSLIEAVKALPPTLAAAIKASPNDALADVADAPSILVLSRGPTLAAASEAALKLKETCLLHAEAYSAAEVMHGPAVLAARGVAGIAFVPKDAGHHSVVSARSALAASGSKVVSFASKGGDVSVPEAGHWALTPVVQTTAFYACVEALSVRLGLDPDAPPGLKKVTETV